MKIRKLSVYRPWLLGCLYEPGKLFRPVSFANWAHCVYNGVFERVHNKTLDKRFGGSWHNPLQPAFNPRNLMDKLDGALNSLDALLKKLT